MRYLPLTKKVVDDFLLNIIAENGFCVEYWDITAIYFKNESMLEHYNTTELDRFKIHRFDCMSDIRLAVKNNRDALYVIVMSFEWRIVPLFRLLTKYDCKISCFAFRMLPWPNFYSNFFKTLKAKFRNIFYLIENRIFLPVVVKFGYIKMYDYLFTGGTEGWRGAGRVKKSYLKNTKFFYLNNFDYDNFICGEDNYDSEGEIVFIDEYYPFHPDSLLFSNNKKMSPDVYYNQLNNVFDFLERKYNKNVIIAAHPKALKYKEKNFFKGRTVVYNSTLSAIKHSSLVLAHDSTAIGYAVMCNKPIIFINSKEIKNCYPYSSFNIDFFSNFFHQPLIDADNVEEERFPAKFILTDESLNVYREIKKKYMTTFDDNVKNRDLIREYLSYIMR